MAYQDTFPLALPDLTPFEIFDVLDGPRFYSCRDLLGQIYIVFWIDDKDGQPVWLYVRVTRERYASMKQGIVSIAHALSNPEEGYAFVVESSTNLPNVHPVPTHQIDPNWLPPEEDRLDLDEPMLPNLDPPLVVARRANRQVFDLAFEKTTNIYEMGCGKLGRILEAIQNTIYAFACGSSNYVRRIPESIKFDSEAMVTGLFAGSFGVRLQTRGADLLASDQSSRAIEALSQLISSLSSPEQVVAQIHEINILARMRFKHLLQVILDSEVAIKAEWGSPRGIFIKSHTSRTQIRAVIQKLEETDCVSTRTVDRVATLVAVHVKKKSFVLLLEENEEIKGKLSGEMATRTFAVPSEVRATLEETCTIDPLTDREKWSYQMINVNPKAPFAPSKDET